MKGLNYGTDEPPAFDDVLSRIQNYRALLYPEVA